MDEETVRDLLRRRGAPDALVAAGLGGLVAAWERFAADVESGYSLGLDDYLNALDLRQLLEDAWGAATDAERAAWSARRETADRRARAALAPAPRCLWGQDVARYHGWDPERQWWYFMRPRHPGATLAAELARGGL